MTAGLLIGAGLLLIAYGLGFRGGRRSAINELHAFVTGVEMLNPEIVSVEVAEEEARERIDEIFERRPQG